MRIECLSPLLITLMFSLTACDMVAGSAGARSELEKMLTVIVDSAATPDPEAMKAGIDEIAKKHGQPAVISELKKVAEEDAKLRLAAVFCLQSYMPTAEFEAFAKRLISAEQYDQFFGPGAQ